MNNNLLKYGGFFLGLLLLMIAAAFFAYPYLNEEKHREVVEHVTGAEEIRDADRKFIGQEFENLNEELERLRKKEKQLQQQVDSLQQENEALLRTVEDLSVERNEVQDGTVFTVAEGAGKNPDGADIDIEEEEFSERVKSLLNLDEEELSPIVNQLSNQQLVRLYRGGGTIQREKLLRALSAERAAELMQEIML